MQEKNGEQPGDPQLREPIMEHHIEEGSVIGAALLFAGTAIGAGMLALPSETAAAGFFPSELSLLLCWFFTFTTSMVTLEASWFVGQDKEKFPEGAGFLSMTRSTLGPAGELVTASMFWFLLTAIIVAYTAKGGELVSGVLNVGASSGSALFMLFFAALAVFGTEAVDIVNRAMVAGLVLTFAGLLAIGLPQIQGNLLLRADYTAIWPSAISIGILSFGAQNVVPTLLQYLGGDAQRTRKAVLLGSLLPLGIYSVWEAVVLGNVPWNPGEDSTQNMQA